MWFWRKHGWQIIWVFKDAWLFTYAKSYLLSHLISWQNLRVVEVGRDLGRLSCPHPCSSRTMQSRLPRTLSTWVFYLQGVRLHSLPGQLLPVLGHPESQNLSSHAPREPPVSVYAHCLWPCHWALLKRAWPCLVHPPLYNSCTHRYDTPEPS